MYVKYQPVANLSVVRSVRDVAKTSFRRGFRTVEGASTVWASSQRPYRSHNTRTHSKCTSKHSSSSAFLSWEAKVRDKPNRIPRDQLFFTRAWYMDRLHSIKSLLKCSIQKERMRAAKRLASKTGSPTLSDISDHFHGGTIRLPWKRWFTSWNSCLLLEVASSSK